MTTASSIGSFANSAATTANRFSRFYIPTQTPGASEPVAVFELTVPETVHLPTVNMDGVGEHEEGHVTRAAQVSTATYKMADIRKVLSCTTQQAGLTLADLSMLNAAWNDLGKLQPESPAPTDMMHPHSPRY